MSNTHEALKLADDLESSSHFPGNESTCNFAGAAMLRTQHALIVQMAEALERIKTASSATVSNPEWIAAHAAKAVTPATQYLKGQK